MLPPAALFPVSTAELESRQANGGGRCVEGEPNGASSNLKGEMGKLKGELKGKVAPRPVEVNGVAHSGVGGARSREASEEAPEGRGAVDDSMGEYAALLHARIDRWAVLWLERDEPIV